MRHRQREEKGSVVAQIPSTIVRLLTRTESKVSLISEKKQRTGMHKGWHAVNFLVSPDWLGF